MSVKFVNRDIRNNRLGNVTFMDTKVTEYLFNDKVVWKYVTPEFTMEASDTSVSEGGEVIVTVTATNMYGGEAYPYTITGITDDDLVEGSVKGFFEMSGAGTGVGVLTIGIKENKDVGDDRTMTVTLDETPHVYVEIEVVDETPPPIEGPMGLFYGGSGGTKVVRLSPAGVKKAEETSGGLGGSLLAGVGLDGLAIFYGGSSSSSGSMVTTRIDREGVVLSSERISDKSRENLTGVKVNSYAIFIGGYGYDETAGSNIPLNATSKVLIGGTLANKGAFIANGRYSFDGVPIAIGGLFYGGIMAMTVDGDRTEVITNQVLRVADYNTSISTTTSVGTSRAGLAAAGGSAGGVFYGGLTAGGALVNTVTKILPDGTIYGVEEQLGHARANFAGVSTGGVNLFYGGENSQISGIDLVSRFDLSGTVLNIESYTTTTYMRQHAGGSI